MPARFRRYVRQVIRRQGNPYHPYNAYAVCRRSTGFKGSTREKNAIKSPPNPEKHSYIVYVNGKQFSGKEHRNIDEAIKEGNASGEDFKLKEIDTKETALKENPQFPKAPEYF